MTLEYAISPSSDVSNFAPDPDKEPIAVIDSSVSGQTALADHVLPPAEADS